MADYEIPKEGRALLDAISGPESGGRYDIRYDGGKGAKIDNFNDHPRVFVSGPHGKTSAAGRYQFTASTWDGVPKDVRPDFSPASQDRAAWFVAQRDYKANTGRDLTADLQSKGFGSHITHGLGSTWLGLKDNPDKANRWYQASLGGGGVPNNAQDAGTPAQPVMMERNLPQTGADQGILMAALADQRQQGILNQARSNGGGSGAFLSSRQMAMDDGTGGGVKPIPVGMQFAGPGAVGAPVTNPGLGAGGANPTSLPSMALNPEALRVGTPSMPGSSPVLKPLSTQTDQPGNLMPSGANTPPALVLNRKEDMAAAAPTGVPLTPVTGQGDGNGPPSYPAAPPGANPGAPPFAGGFFDRLQSSGIGDSLTRAGAALMARDNPTGAAALLGGLKDGKSRTVPGEIKQMQDGSFAREVTDRETGNVSMVPVSTTQVPQEVLDAAKARQLALSKAQQADTEHTEDRTLDRAYKEAKLQKLNGQDAKGAPDLTTPEGQQREREDALHAERYVGPMSSKMSKDERSRAVGYLARHGTSPEEVRQSQTKSTADLAGLREMAKVKDLAAISSGEAVSALDKTTKNVNSYYGTVQDTGIPKVNELKFAAARNGLLGEEAAGKAAAVEVSFNELYSQIAQAANKTGNATVSELKRQMETYGPSMPRAMWEAAAEVLGANVKGTQESRQNVYERQNAIDSGQKPPAAPEKKAAKTGGGLIDTYNSMFKKD